MRRAVVRFTVEGGIRQAIGQRKLQLEAPLSCRVYTTMFLIQMKQSGLILWAQLYPASAEK